MVVAKHDVVAAKIHYIPVVTLDTIEGGKPVPANRDNGSSKKEAGCSIILSWL